uniref:Uncharacterized protein n=1 Tax=Pavo cristatus TaxID=9049 RepID=A0A8C9G352_PAVCR
MCDTGGRACFRRDSKKRWVARSSYLLLLCPALIPDPNRYCINTKLYIYVVCPRFMFSFPLTFSIFFYGLLQSKGISMGTMRTVVGEGATPDCKTALQEYRNFNSVIPDAPPAYDKIAAEQSPPPYSP